MCLIAGGDERPVEVEDGRRQGGPSYPGRANMTDHQVRTSSGGRSVSIGAWWRSGHHIVRALPSMNGWDIAGRGRERIRVGDDELDLFGPMHGTNTQGWTLASSAALTR